MRHLIKRMALCALAAALGLGLFGCYGVPGLKQEAADSAEEATVHFLTNLQNGEFEMACTYLKEGNELLHVFPIGEEAAVPELDEVYRQFCEKLSGLTFHVAEGEVSANSVVFITARQYDFASAINAAMLDAMATQCREGGNAFADYAGWMGRGIAEAQMGAEGTKYGTATLTNGRYIIQHQGYGDEAFLNLITGGFYDYADLQMAVCTASMDGVEHTYYVLGLGDRVIAYMEETAEKDETGDMDDETIAGLNEFYLQASEQTPGVYMGVHRDGDKVVMATGIDMETADQNMLINAGLVSGKFKGNMTSSYLSFAATVSSFEKSGITCSVTPVYEAEE